MRGGILVKHFVMKILQLYVLETVKEAGMLLVLEADVGHRCVSNKMISVYVIISRLFVFRYLINKIKFQF